MIGVSHIPIGVTDMDRSLNFWRDFLGLDVTGDTAAQTAEIADRRTVFLRWNPDDKTSAASVFVSLTVNLLVGPFGDAAKLGQVGVNHIAFWVDDLDAYLVRARHASIRIESEPIDHSERMHPFGDLDRSVCVRTAMFADPDGVIVQLDEWSDRPDTARLTD